MFQETLSPRARRRSGATSRSIRQTDRPHLRLMVVQTHGRPPTPVGNLSDMTTHVEVLKKAHAVLAETPDHGKTPATLESTPRWAFHQHNEHRALTGVVQQLEGG